MTIEELKIRCEKSYWKLFFENVYSFYPNHFRYLLEELVEFVGNIKHLFKALIHLFLIVFAPIVYPLIILLIRIYSKDYYQKALIEHHKHMDRMFPNKMFSSSASKEAIRRGKEHSFNKSM